MTDYEDILYLPHHVSPKRQPMSMEDRAAQFSPFAALTGYEAAIDAVTRTIPSPPPGRQSSAPWSRSPGRLTRQR